MTSDIQERLRNRCHDMVKQALSDEGALTFDQATAVGRAIMGVVDILIDAALSDGIVKGE